MHLIVGLGNPGEKYANTRHNVGFRAIYSLAKAYTVGDVSFKHKALIAMGKIAGERVLLAQPQTYMNNSGEAVRLLIDYYKIPRKDVIIIYDDLDLPTGKLRLKLKGSSGGHNGLKSVIAHLGIEEFARIRVGIDRPPGGQDVVDYVLECFDSEEEKIIENSMADIVDAVKMIFTDGFQAVMNKYN